MDMRFFTIMQQLPNTQNNLDTKQIKPEYAEKLINLCEHAKK
jgi:hypothetical protein